MKKIGTYFKSFWQSVKEKPIICAIFVVTILISVITSGIFYRKALYTFKFEIHDVSYSISFKENFSRKQLYDLIQGTNITHVGNNYIYLDRDGEEVSSNDKGAISYSCEYFPKKGVFTKAQLDSGQKITVVTSAYADKMNVNIGDNINIKGEKFNIVGIRKDKVIQAYFPASSDLLYKVSGDWDVILFSSRGKVSESILKTMNSNGWHVRLSFKPDNSDAYESIAVGAALMLLALLNIFVAYKFIADKNSKRYSLFKTMGAKNRDIAVMMVMEAFGVVLLSFFLGILLEYCIAKSIINKGFAPLNIKDYAILFGLNCFLAMATTIWMVIKKAIAQPIDCKQRGRQ